MAENNSVKPTQDILNNCLLELCERKVASINQVTAEKTNAQAENEAAQFSMYCYNMTDSMLDIYCNLDRCYVIPVTQQKKLIKGRIELLIEKNTTLSTKYKDLVKMIRDVREKYNDVLDEACKLGRCLEEEERCNPDTYNALANAELISEVAGLETKTKKCYEKLCRTVDASIDIAGIQTFTNIKSIVPYCDNVMVFLDELGKDVNDNITYINTQLAKDKKSVGEAIESVMTASFEQCNAEINMETICEIYDDVASPDCRDALRNGENTIEDICKKLQKEGLEDENDDCAKLRIKIATGSKITAKKQTISKATKKPATKAKPKTDAENSKTDEVS